MRRVAAVLASIPLLAATAGAAADGVWTLKERFCIVADGKHGCSRGLEDFMFNQGIAYWRSDASEQWTEVGAVATSGNNVVVTITPEGVGRVVGNRIGIDITDYITDSSFTYRGRLHGDRITNGHAHVNIGLDVDGDRHRIKGGATFQARRIGDAYPIPPADPYFGAISASARGRSGPATLSTVGARLRSIAPSKR